jgi:regulator of sirC expression with transglutaminase-like and TPR domain
MHDAGGAPMNVLSPAVRALDAVLRLPDDAIDLGQAALLIARQEYPDLEVDRYLRVLDDMGADLRARLRGGEVATSRIAHLNRYLFDELGYRGNVDEFFDPRNSFLNDVLDRRTGIPISLSTVYLEVGRRCGFPLAGVSFPGHFLVRYTAVETGTELLVDPFNRGVMLTPEDCRERLETMFGGGIAFRPELLRRARNREILERMLANLKAIWDRACDVRRELRVQNVLLILRPDSPAHLRDRGLLHYRAVLLAEAAADLEGYLAAAPRAPDAEVIRSQIVRLKALSPVMN